MIIKIKLKVPIICYHSRYMASNQIAIACRNLFPYVHYDRNHPDEILLQLFSSVAFLQELPAHPQFALSLAPIKRTEDNFLCPLQTVES